MSRRVLISGSVAYDTIMVFEGHFKDHILPERVHRLNVSFLTPRLKREFGGCAANIAYNLALLGGEAAVVAAIGPDGEGYKARLAELGIDVSQLLVLPDFHTPQAFIITDLSDNQFTAFHPGAMGEAQQADPTRLGSLAWAIVGPNGKAAMVDHSRALHDAGVRYIFDPGQGLPLFEGDELVRLVDSASAVAVNDYEHGLILQKTGWSDEEFIRRAGVLIITRGGEGSDLYVEGKQSTIASVPIAKPVDPTGCGDAYRGGLLYGLSQGWDWLRSARLGSVMGAIKIEHQGPQNHAPTREAIAERFAGAYGEKPWA